MRTFLVILFFLLVPKDDFFAQLSLSKEVFQTSGHPSLLLSQGEENALKNAVLASPKLNIVHQAILDESDKMMGKPALTYLKTGRRLLDVSRECLKRVFYWSYCYRMTGDGKYAKRAEEEMLAVSGFTDWNPSHFLDVAEMTIAVSIGYDWLYETLSENSKKTIEDAIVQKGLEPSKNEKDAWFLNVSHNWNQVCNAGMLFGAIAVRQKNPELAKFIVERSLRSVRLPMRQYEPDGNYNEGYTYWGYGTGFNVLLISAAEKFLGKNLFPADSIKGLMKSASYLLHVVGTSSKPFNYSDCGSGTTFNSPVFWFAERSGDVGLLYNELKSMRADNKQLVQDRLLPTVILWGKGLDLNKSLAPPSNYFIGNGASPVCLMRSAWADSNAVFVGVKAGSPSENHGHMDVGSFVMDALGVRWACDLGAQNYNSLESKGLDIWDMKQSSDRWRVFRYSNLAHNTLAFDDSLQRVEGRAYFERHQNKKNELSCTADLASLYKGQVSKAIRTVAIKEEKYVSIKDEIVAGERPSKLRWSLLTEATPQINQEKKEILLTLHDRELLVKVESVAKITLKAWSTVPTNDYDAPNPGTVIVGFEAELAPSQTANFTVSLTPQLKK